MHLPLLPLVPLIVLGLAAFVLIIFLFYKVMSFSLQRMGIPRHLVIPAFAAIVIASFFDIVVWRSDSTTIAVNVGGAIIPLFISFYLLLKAPLLKTALAVAVVATVAGLLAEVDAEGIRLRFGWLILPLTAVSLGLILARHKAPRVAFIAGTVGAVIGVDVIHLRELIDLGAPTMSIGGRGVFDGILTTGIISALLAGLLWRNREPDAQLAE